MTGGAGKPVEITGVVRHETAQAWLIFDGSCEAWLPKAIVTVKPAKRGKVVVAMPHDLAKRKGLLGAPQAEPELF